MTPTPERRVDNAKRINFDSWLYIRHGLPRDTWDRLCRACQDEFRALYINDVMWQLSLANAKELEARKTAEPNPVEGAVSFE